MSLFHDSALVGSSGQSTGYTISRSLRFNASDSAYCSRVFSSAGNRTTWTWSTWVKRTNLTDAQYSIFAAGSGSNYDEFRFNTSDKFRFFIVSSGAVVLDLITTQVFRDPSSWYHIVVAYDSTQATASNRAKIFVNGSQITAFDTATYPAQNTSSTVNNNVEHDIGLSPSSFRFNGYLADIYFIDGQALTPSSFAETNATTGQWVPKAYSGTYGTNGFQLKFADNSAATATTLGKDTSGNSNNWTPNNLSVTAGAGNDSLVDTPTSYGTDTGAGGEVRGNYATWNPLRNDQGATLSNGNLDLSTAGSTSRTGTYATIGVTTGKWYWEITAGSLSTDGYNVGIASSIKGLTDPLGSTAESYIYINGGTKRNNNTTTSYGATYTAGDVIGVALDLNAGSLTFYKNGASQGTAFTGIPVRDWFPIVADDATASTSGASFIANFGQRPFAYTAPSGFKALCDTNLPAPVVAKPNTVFDVKLYTGNGGTQAISGLGFSPDLVWVKGRSTSARNRLFNVLSGVQKELYSDLTNAEATDANGIQSFDSAGFTLGSNDANTNGTTYVAWTWDAGSSTVTNTQGSITSQVRANASAGFSILTYTGATNSSTIGHGLGVAPSFIISKSRGGAGQWVIYHAALGFNYYGGFSTAAFANNSAAWKTSPTSSVYTIGSAAEAPILNTTGETYVSYCFAPVAGYSSFGSYVGNGSTDGPFVYTGFRPAFVLVKGTANGLIWTIEDNKRDAYNGTSKYLQPQSSNAEGSVAAPHYDFTSNGFKIRTTDSAWNQSSNTYIYFAVAESPFAYSRAR